MWAEADKAAVVPAPSSVSNLLSTELDNEDKALVASEATTPRAV